MVWEISCDKGVYWIAQGDITTLSEEMSVKEKNQG